MRGSKGDGGQGVYMLPPWKIQTCFNSHFKEDGWIRRIKCQYRDGYDIEN